MLYFIPAWYHHNDWCENEQNWYSRKKHTEFDDTVKQVQLFHRSKAYPYNILLLSFAPNLRHFLHRQGVYRAPYWSCFDAICKVKRKKAMVLSIHNLNWPENIEFIYSSFVVLAFLNGQKYAHIEFGEDGNPIQIDIYKNGQLNRRNIYDDRGFVASTILYEDEKPLYQDYLTENGVWKCRRFYEDGHVEINPKDPCFLICCGDLEQEIPFSKNRYSKIDDVISEVLNAYLNKTSEGDIFCVAAHNRHMDILGECLRNRKTVLSFFEDRYQIQSEKDSMLILNTDYAITDSARNLGYIRMHYPYLVSKSTDITPYDSRVDFGISSRLNVKKILVPVDDLDREIFDKLVLLMADYACNDSKIRVVFFTRRASLNRDREILETASKVLEINDFDSRLVGDMTAQVEGEVWEVDNLVDDVEEVEQIFWVSQCVDELAVSKCMREQRLLVDLRDKEELYLQISAISMGIPQIVKNSSQYVEHGKNGLVVGSIDEVIEGMSFYLNNLNNWNEAMINSHEMGKEHTTENLIAKWKEVIDSIG